MYCCPTSNANAVAQQNINILTQTDTTITIKDSTRDEPSEINFDEIEKISGQSKSELIGSENKNNFFKWFTTEAPVDKTGFLVSSVDGGNRDVLFRWKNPSEPVISELTKRALEFDIDLKFEEAPFSMGEFKRNQQVVVDSLEKLSEQGIELSGIRGVGKDTTYMHVMLVKGDTGTDTASLQEERMQKGLKPVSSSSEKATQVANMLKDNVSVPFFVTETERSAPLAKTRTRDYRNYYAGGYMKSPNGALCSNGFTFYKEGKFRLSTAAHCNRSDYTARFNGNEHHHSTWWNHDPGTATRLMLGSHGTNRMFYTGFNNYNGLNKVVGDFQYVQTGDKVCSSGGNSGLICTGTVTSLSEVSYDGYSAYVAMRVKRDNGQKMAMGGDSGGPVFSFRPDGKVRAAGLIQAIAPGSGLPSYMCGPGVDFNFFTSRCGSSILVSNALTYALNSGSALAVG